MSDSLPEATAAALDRLAPPTQPVLVAVSGGSDSLALLDLLQRGARWHGRPLVVAHVDHGIAPQSADVAGRVAGWAARRGLPFVSRALALGAAASETTARRARRPALRAMAAEVGAGAIALGHHADDQVETILLRVLRGSGPAGLAGMAPSQGRWVRPLLTVPRAVLDAHCLTLPETPWDDPANRDPTHLRSWLRAEVLPLLERRLPDLRSRLLDLGAQAADARAGWDAIPALLPDLEVARSADGLSVAAPPLRGYRSEVRRALLAALGRQLGVLIGARRAVAIERLLASERSGRSVRLDPALEVELAGGRLHFRAPIAPDQGESGLPEVGVVAVGPWQVAVATGVAGATTREGSPVGWFTPGPLAARTWRPGDRIRPLGGTGSRPVGVLLREAGVPRGRRASWPVILGPVGADATILWVPGICRADGRVPAEGTEARRVECIVA